MWNGHVLQRGRYHGPNCRCELDDRSDSEFCHLSRLRAAYPSRRLLASTVIVRSAILLIELPSLLMALSVPDAQLSKSYVRALTPKPKNFGIRANATAQGDGRRCRHFRSRISQDPRGTEMKTAHCAPTHNIISTHRQTSLPKFFLSPLRTSYISTGLPTKLLLPELKKKQLKGKSRCIGSLEFFGTQQA